MIRVTPYTSACAADFLQIHRACLAWYGIPAATPAQETRILSLLDTERHMACHLAFDTGDRPVGFATWGLSFPAGASISLVMKELFVAPDAQGKGVGRALLADLIGVAKAEGCARLDWATDGSNRQAQAFYAGIGAPQNPKISYRLPAADFDTFRQRLAR